MLATKAVKCALVSFIGTVVGAATLYWYSTESTNIVLTPVTTCVLFPGIVVTGGIHRSPPWFMLFTINWGVYVIVAWAIAVIRARYSRH